MEPATDCLFWQILWELDLPHLSKWSKVNVNIVLNADLKKDTQRMPCGRMPIENVCLFVCWLLFFIFSSPFLVTAQWDFHQILMFYSRRSCYNCQVQWRFFNPSLWACDLGSIETAMIEIQRIHWVAQVFWWLSSPRNMNLCTFPRHNVVQYEITESGFSSIRKKSALKKAEKWELATSPVIRFQAIWGVRRSLPERWKYTESRLWTSKTVKVSEHWATVRGKDHGLFPCTHPLHLHEPDRQRTGFIISFPNP